VLDERRHYLPPRALARDARASHTHVHE